MHHCACQFSVYSKLECTTAHSSFPSIQNLDAPLRMSVSVYFSRQHPGNLRSRGFLIFGNCSDRLNITGDATTTSIVGDGIIGFHHTSFFAFACKYCRKRSQGEDGIACFFCIYQNKRFLSRSSSQSFLDLFVRHKSKRTESRPTRSMDLH